MAPRSPRAVERRLERSGDATRPGCITGKSRKPIPHRDTHGAPLVAEDCLKVYTDRASGTKAERPQWNLCLGDLRAGDTLIIWRIDRLGRNLRDLIDIVTTLQTCGIGVRSLSNGIVDTTTSCGVTPMTIYRNIRTDRAITP